MNHWTRQIHRWSAVVFTLAVIANFVAIGMGKQENPPGPVTFAPLLPLFIMFLTGVYLFVLPYLKKRAST
jgi:hypothetical protein